MRKILHVNSTIFAIDFGPVVQLNRISDFGSDGYRFESCRGHIVGKTILGN